MRFLTMDLILWTISVPYGSIYSLNMKMFPSSDHTNFMDIAILIQNIGNKYNIFFETLLWGMIMLSLMANVWQFTWYKDV